MKVWAQFGAAAVCVWAAIAHTPPGALLRAGARSVWSGAADNRALVGYYRNAAPPPHIVGTAPPPELVWGRAANLAWTALPAADRDAVSARLAARGLNLRSAAQAELAARIAVAESGGDDAAAMTLFCGDALTRFAADRAASDGVPGTVEAMAGELPPDVCAAQSAALTTMTLLTAYRLSWPLAAPAAITSTFGVRMHPILGEARLHGGIDISVPDGTPVLAAGAGQVLRAAFDSGFGGRVVVAHGHGVVTSYAHAAKLEVQAGDRATRGERLALSGHAGLATGPHLHFAVELSGASVDPLTVVRPP
jgi:murein DD-endopeptidase MepM/ murein hydrolase activator NlpD